MGVANLAEYADCTAYRVDTTVFADGPATGGLGECRDGDWYMTPIEGTNVFLIGVAGYSILSICDTKNPVRRARGGGGGGGGAADRWVACHACSVGILRLPWPALCPLIHHPRFSSPSSPNTALLCISQPLV